ncbi:MAG: hypothetical protein KDB00_07515 [Planctomycetales bacterium]|nr:hypothetical protein [Planctomycetales bacterium]
MIKIGGSLLRQNDLVCNLQNWLCQQTSAETLAIVGGGEMIDAVRRLDATFACDPAWLHWQCVGLLQFTFHWLGRQLDDWQLHATPDQFSDLTRQLQQTRQPRDVTAPDGSQDSAKHLIDVNSFYRAGLSSPLPEDWTTTTDAIAGWLAILVDADELVLLKSCDVDETKSLAELADEGVIDRALLTLADQLPPIRFVNFAAESVA